MPVLVLVPVLTLMTLELAIPYSGITSVDLLYRHATFSLSLSLTFSLSLSQSLSLSLSHSFFDFFLYLFITKID